MNIFQREQRSLFGEILDWMLTPLLLVWPVSLALTWLVAQELANKPFDRALEYNARALAQLLVAERGEVRFALPRPASELLRADDADMVYYQVVHTPDPQQPGAHLSGERDLPRPSAPIEPSSAIGADLGLGTVHLRDDSFRGVDIRIAALWVPLSTTPPAWALVQVGETREKRSVLATEIIKGVMLPQFVILPLSVLLVWMALARGIKPLHQLEGRIRARKPDDLSPLNHTAVPMEVAPLVDAVNDLLRRLSDSIGTQKRFLADAAHQLKTPLAGLRMQADLAQREGTSHEDLKRSLHHIGRSSMRATHTVNQLLSLARAEGASTILQSKPCDLAALVVDVVQDCLPRAMDKHIDLGYDGPAPGSRTQTIAGNATLLQELVRNLVDNAINYTPSSAEAPGMVTVRVIPDPFGRVVVLQIDDTGPGVPASERELVFQPFYRALGNEADGSGLGLPIVQEIARQHGAHVTLEEVHPGHPMPGARFTVRFPLRTAPAMAPTDSAIST